MFGKSKEDIANERDPAAVQQFQRPGIASPVRDAAESVSSISSGTTIVGKVVSDGTVNILGRLEGEIQASTVAIADGAQVDGEIVAEDLTVGGRVKGTIHANRVRLNGTAVVEGDIFHRSLAIEEHARFEGSSRREEAEPAQASRAQSQSQSTPGEATRKSNGTNGNGETHSPAV